MKEIKETVEDTTTSVGETEVENKPEKIELKTCEDWEYFLTNYLANLKCTKCFGRGYTGWQTNDNGERMPKICSAKKCALHNLQMLQRQQRIEELKKKQELKVKGGEE